MSLLLMLLALTSAMVVIGLGALVMDRLWCGSGPERPAGAKRLDGPSAPAPNLEDGSTQVGGYTFLPEPPATAPEPGLPGTTIARVRRLVAEGRELDAVRLVQAHAGVDARWAREIVARISESRF